jgi:hypothetical protein
MPTSYESIEELQNLLVAHATGRDVESDRYAELRRELLSDSTCSPLAPPFLRDCRDVAQFFVHIRQLFPSYAERRRYIWDAFAPILITLEGRSANPADDQISGALDMLSAENVRTIWERALERRAGEPDGAITMARTLLETTCKHILDDLGETYDEGAELPRLYRQTAESLNLAPSQHTEQIFRQVLGGCTAVVEGIGAIRNRLGDAHGRGRSGYRAQPRHAELAVNLAGSMAMFLVATWRARTGAA